MSKRNTQLTSIMNNRLRHTSTQSESRLPSFRYANRDQVSNPEELSDQIDKADFSQDPTLPKNKKRSSQKQGQRTDEKLFESKLKKPTKLSKLLERSSSQNPIDTRSTLVTDDKSRHLLDGDDSFLTQADNQSVTLKKAKKIRPPSNNKRPATNQGSVLKRSLSANNYSSPYS